jgi:hypothetical protein
VQIDSTERSAQSAAADFRRANPSFSVSPGHSKRSSVESRSRLPGGR